MESRNTFMPRSVQLLGYTLVAMAAVTSVGDILAQRKDSLSDEILEQAKNDIPEWVKFLFNDSQYTVRTLPNTSYLVTNQDGEVFILTIFFPTDKDAYGLLEVKSNVNDIPQKSFTLTLQQLVNVLSKLPVKNK